MTDKKYISIREKVEWLKTIDIFDLNDTQLSMVYKIMFCDYAFLSDTVVGSVSFVSYGMYSNRGDLKLIPLADIYINDDIIITVGVHSGCEWSVRNSISKLLTSNEFSYSISSSNENGEFWSRISVNSIDNTEDYAVIEETGNDVDVTMNFITCLIMWKFNRFSRILNEMSNV